MLSQKKKTKVQSITIACVAATESCVALAKQERWIFSDPEGVVV